MPNWCDSWIEIECKDEKSAEYVYNTIESWTEKLSVESDFGKNWLGNILVNAGLFHSLDELLNPEKNNLGCRGWVENIQLDDCSVIIQTQTAWRPMMKMWKEIANKIFPQEVEEILYTATEIGDKLYWSNDPAYKDAWYYEDDEGYDECASEEEMKRYLLNHAKGKIKKKDLNKYSVDELDAEVKKINGLSDNSLYELQKYEFVLIDSEEMW